MKGRVFPRSELGDEEEEHDDGGDDNDDAPGERPAVEILVHLGVGLQAPQLPKEVLHWLKPLDEKREESKIEIDSKREKLYRERRRRIPSRGFYFIESKKREGEKKATKLEPV